MRAVVFKQPGDEDVLELGEVPDPTPGPDDILIDVRGTALNRADLMQRRGVYPPPPGASEILGLECAGDVLAVGAKVKGWHVGDRAMALLAGGGYAERAVVNRGSAMHVPAALSYEEAAAIPEACLTAYLNLFMLAEARSGHSVLVHGGGSGVGTAAIQLLKLAGITVLITAGSQEKCAKCIELGANYAINYREGEFAPKVMQATSGKGVDVVLDSIGAAYLSQNIQCLSKDGRLVLIAVMKGARAEIDLVAILHRHLHIIGSTLRSRSVEEKAAIVEAFIGRFGKDLEAGRIRPPIHQVLPLERVREAHRKMQASEHFGKLVLRVS